MDTVNPSIIGWDLGLGGGERAKELPCPPEEILLVQANETWVDGTEGYRYGNIEIWGLHPEITVAVAFYRTPNPNRTTEFSLSNITATIAAYPIVLSKQGNALYGFPALPSSLFLNGGKLDSYDDGCELETGMQGVRFNLAALRTGGTTVDIVASIQAKPNVSLGCESRARKLISQLVVKVGPPGKF